MDYSIKIGGEAGQGIQTIGDTFAKVFSRTGYHVFTHQNYENPHFLDVPFIDLAVKHSGNKIMANTVAVGAVLGMLGMKLDILTKIIEDTFEKKGAEIIKGNINAAKVGYDFAREKCLRCTFIVKWDQCKTFMLINGIESIGVGAISSGCRV